MDVLEMLTHLPVCEQRRKVDEMNDDGTIQDTKKAFVRNYN